METYNAQLLQTLNQIEGSGSFVVSGTKDFMPLGLAIKGVNEISFPITTAQIEKMIKVAHKAPFGKGSQTIVDTNVRSAWEIDAKNISFLNKNWDKFLDTLLTETKAGLGLEKQTISANLYKLLIYETGDFFLPHKDSEKEAGMFGTLIIGLPSRHSGGSLFVRFNGEEEIIDFSDAENDYKLPFTAFFADCEHEIKPITSGHRVCLVYNLVQKQNGKMQIRHATNQEAINDLAQILSRSEAQFPFAVLLGHQYTPANFSMEALKLNDYPRAEALMQAAEKAGFYAKLGLMTSYKMGDLEIPYNRNSRRRYRSYDEYDDDDTGNGVMGSEIYEESISIKHWAVDGLPPLSEIELDEDDIITDIEIGEGEPMEKAAEGYTGNAGMTIEYWYHYGAIVLWRKSDHFGILDEQNIEVKLAWLTYYLNNWETADKKAVKNLIVNFDEHDLKDSHNPPDFSVVVAIFIKLNEEKFIESEVCQALLVRVFDKISVEQWLQLLDVFDVTIFKSAFKKAGKSNKISRVKHITAILEGLQKADSKKTNTFLMKRLGNMPTFLNEQALEKEDNSKHSKAIVDNLLRLSLLKNDDETWIENTVNSLVKAMPRKYVNDVLADSLLASKKNKDLNLAKHLFQICQQDLINRTIIKPTPPATWTREVPKGTYYSHEWEKIRPFLESPTQQVFDYARVQAVRSSMENAVRNTTIDLKMETIKKGSPHTLRLTKTQAAYQADLKRWEVDMALLKNLEAFYA